MKEALSIGRIAGSGVGIFACLLLHEQGMR